MRFVVYGAGAIGGIVGARLHGDGHDVTLVARGAHFEAIRDRGLTLVETGGDRAVLPIPVVDRIAAALLEDDTFVLLGMKGQDTEAALQELAACAPPGIAVACLQNGVDNERMALRRFEAVYGVCVMCPGVHLEPGIVESNAGPVHGILDLGRYPDGVDERAEALAGALDDAGFLSQPRHDIMAWKYTKLLGNLNNALVALGGREAAMSDAGKVVRAEAERVLRAAGIAFVSMEEFRGRWELMTRAHRDNRSDSSSQSLHRGTGTIEADFLNGEIVLLARLHGLDAPANATVQRMARRLALERGRPGSVPVETILDAVSSAVAVA